MNKCFIFAHYDSNNLIKQYIIDEINLLNKLGDVLFISDCEYITNIHELPHVKYLQIARHSLYDAHSYMCGFNYLRHAKLLDNYDSITFVNSSILFPKCDEKLFVDTLCEFDECKEQVYGMCKSVYMLQSYWITCKNKTYPFVEKFFNDYIPATIENVRHWYDTTEDKKLIDKYNRWYVNRVKEVGEEIAMKWIYTVVHFEEGFSKYLYNSGFDLVALDYCCWPKSRFITKYPRESSSNTQVQKELV